MVSMKLVEAVKEADFFYDTYLIMQGEERKKVTFFGKKNDNYIHFYSESGQTDSFEHYTTLNEQTFHPIVKGFIAGMVRVRQWKMV